MLVLLLLLRALRLGFWLPRLGLGVAWVALGALATLSSVCVCVWCVYRPTGCKRGPPPLVVCPLPGREVDDVGMVGDGDALFATSSSNMPKATSSSQNCGNYRVEQCLGRGSFGKVYKGVHQVTKQPVALKFIFKSAMGTIRDVERVVGEIQCLESLVHPNVIALREVLTTEKGHVVLAMEFAGGGDLFRLVNAEGRLTEAAAAPLFSQILDGVAYCHRYGGSCC